MNAHQITTKVLALYDTNTVNVDAIVDELYHKDAVFADPLVEVHGRDKVAAQFRILSTFLSSMSATIIRGSVAGATVLTIDSIVSARFWPFPQYFGCSFRMFTILELQDLKIVSHTDHWDMRTVLENFPLAPSIYPKLRFVVGESTSRMINTFMPRQAALPQELLQLEEVKQTD
ncbi:hypothetical protein Ae201684P_008367 [Aphanomyces euteiches]|uniref:SnoaL-like domain-containing protein n=1 Tax=Aphanomyces euteiches TaxID=100861 RepID=A0A6G0XNM9_9STRA|nr:hypothetical protein Ae201684_002763 [Aphanomyces euteiches]KAH9092697.1 hypothetical protein Ae201684P_008367 [Aphanomyces euteiches]